MKNKRLVYPQGGAVLLILALLVLFLLLPRLQKGPIRVKTALKPEEVVGHRGNCGGFFRQRRTDPYR